MRGNGVSVFGDRKGGNEAVHDEPVNGGMPGGRSAEDVLLAAALAHDLDGSFEQLVLTYQDQLFGFALRLTGSPRDAEEIAQDTFVRAYRALAGYPSERVRGLQPRPWLYRIALNVTRNRARGRRLALVPLDGLVAQPPADEAARPEATADRAEREAELGALVAALPERYRAALILRHVEGFRYAEVATLLNQPVGTVKANVHRGIRLLRVALEPRQVSNPRIHAASARRAAR